MVRYYLLQLAGAIDNTDIGIPDVKASPTQLSQVIAAVFLVIGSISLLFILIGAFRYVISNGDQGQISQAKNTILYAVIGMVISMLAFTIVQFVLGSIGR